MKIDRRISYKIVLDTETCPINKDLNEVVATNMWTYDCGWAVVDKRGKVYRKRSYVNADIFCDEKELMNSAYYANKIPKYWEDIKNGERVLTTFANIRKALLEDIEEFDIDEYNRLVTLDLENIDNSPGINSKDILTTAKFYYFYFVLQYMQFRQFVRKKAPF